MVDIMVFESHAHDAEHRRLDVRFIGTTGEKGRLGKEVLENCDSLLFICLLVGAVVLSQKVTETR